MDSRKKKIADLEAEKRKSLLALDLIREEMGSRLLERIGEGDFPSPDPAEYRRLRQEMADLEGAIKVIEEDSLRIQALDEEMEIKKEQRSAGFQELSGLYRKLGRRMLEDPRYGDRVIFYRQRTDALLPKIEGLEARLAELENREGSSLFTWIGKSAQALAVRSSLAAAHKDVERLYEAAGEQFSRPGGDGPDPGEQADLLGDIEKSRGRLQALTDELAGLREERRKIAAASDSGGGAVKRIRGLEQGILRVREELKSLYRRFGGEASEQEHKRRFAALLDEEDWKTLEQTALIRQTLQQYDDEIARHRASLEIDAEKAEIEKLKKAVAEQQNRIAAAETAIAEYTKKITEAQSRIKELSEV
jgi:chromosome segregation ATPase